MARTTTFRQDGKYRDSGTLIAGASFVESVTTPADSVLVSGTTFNIDAIMPTAVAVTITCSGLYNGIAEPYFKAEKDGATLGSIRFYTGNTQGTGTPWTSGDTKSLYRQTPVINTLNTADYFNSSNASVREIDVPWTISLPGNFSGGLPDFKYVVPEPNSISTTLSQKIILNVPPTFDAPVLSLDTSSAYAGITTASVTVSNATAYYGGSISSATLTIGNQTASISGNGTISILLNSGGTFTPTVTVTDSRGQTTTETLDPLTVNVYTAPSVSFDVARTLNDGTPNDEGTYGLIEAELTFSDVVATAQAPSVVLTDDGGTQTTPSVTWYTDSSLTTQVTWANVSSGDTVYGLFSGLSTQHSYQVSVRPRDSEGTGTAVTQTIAPAFYTIDFYAGGHGIALGKPASNPGFECAMTATFEDTATFGSDIYIDLSDYQTTGSVDKELYDAIVALGWDSDVLVN